MSTDHPATAGTVSTIRADGTFTNIAADDVGRLLAVVGDIDPSRLDDLVHDCCDRAAAGRFNSDEALAHENVDDAVDAAYAHASEIGSGVNNEGVPAQVAFLLAELGTAATALVVACLRGDSPT
jgi:hypothetical protein